MALVSPVLLYNLVYFVIVYSWTSVVLNLKTNVFKNFYFYKFCGSFKYVFIRNVLKVVPYFW